MTVLHISGVRAGGAAKACFRLHKGLLKNGLDSRVLLPAPPTESVEHFKSYKKPEITDLNGIKAFTLDFLSGSKKQKAYRKFSERQKKQQAFIASRPKGLEMFSFPDSNFDLTKSPFYREADIIHLHWVAKYLDFESFFEKNTKPVVWTFHDMNAFTGGEHSAEIYTGLDTQTGMPLLRQISKEEEAVHKEVLERKAKALKSVKSLHVITPSAWMEKASSAGELFGRFPHTTIPNSTDTDIFKYRNKPACKEALGLPKDKTIFLFVADTLKRTLKGFIFLAEAIRKLQAENQPFFLCTVGYEYHDPKVKIDRQFGFVRDELLMSMIYAASDAFIIPSLMDNLPNTVIESLCSGTPVIGFPTGGIPEMISPGNGLVTNKISVNALAEKIKEFHKKKGAYHHEEIAYQAKKKYGLSVQAKAVSEIYNSLL